MSPSSMQANSGTLLLHIRSILPELNEQEQKVARYVVEHATEVVHLSVSETADRCGVSDATVFRFSKRAGAEGYQDMKIRLAQELHLSISRPYPELGLDDSVASTVKKVLQTNMKSLEETLDMLDVEALDEVADALLAAHRVDIYASAGGIVVAGELQYRLVRFGVRAVGYQDHESQLISASQLTAEDVAVGVSHSGETQTVHRALETAKAVGAITVALVNHPASPIGKLAQLCLATSAPEIQEHGYPLGARTAQVAVIDALSAVMALKRPNAARDTLEHIASVLNIRKE
jgi:RpiR family transcriptional regulator, carbohydrate utilization regulator